MKKRKNEIDRSYEKELNAIVDRIFEIAADDYVISWGDLATAAGLSYGCVYNLGERNTRLPQHRTVWRLAKAVGLRLELTSEKKFKQRAA